MCVGTGGLGLNIFWGAPFTSSPQVFTGHVDSGLGAVVRCRAGPQLPLLK